MSIADKLIRGEYAPGKGKASPKPSPPETAPSEPPRETAPEPAVHGAHENEGGTDKTDRTDKTPSGRPLGRDLGGFVGFVGFVGGVSSRNEHVRRAPSRQAIRGAHEAFARSPEVSSEHGGGGGLVFCGRVGRRSTWDASDWQAHFEERAAIREHDGGLDRAEAERQAFADCVIEWRNANPAPGQEGRCSHCGQGEIDGVPLLPYGRDGAHGSHAWLHDRCWPDWDQSRYVQALRALEAMGLTVVANTSALASGPEGGVT